MARTAFITGASSGIGAALAQELAGRGYDLFLTGRRHAALEEVRASIAGNHPDREVAVRGLDVTDDADVVAAIAEAADRFGRIDLVVANAGIGSGGTIGDGNFAGDKAVIETNVIGAMATVDAAVALFRRQGGGQIVGIASVAAYRGMPGTGAYSASKAALKTYLDAVRAETYREPITVTTLSPGYIDTPLNEEIRNRPFLIDVEKGARLAADLIERGVGESPVPRWPWRLVVPALRRMPTRMLARNAPRR